MGGTLTKEAAVRAGVRKRRPPLPTTASQVEESDDSDAESDDSDETTHDF